MRKAIFFLLGMLLTQALHAQFLVSHRGAKKWAPENTIPAFDKAIALGADYLEMDVRQTLDGHLVVIHDATVNRTTNGSGRVEDLTLAEIQSLDAGSWFSARYKGTKVPTLREVLYHIKGRAMPDIDFKAGDAQRLVKVLRETGFLQTNKVTVYTSNTQRLDSLNKYTQRVLIRPPAPTDSLALLAFRNRYDVDVVNVSGKDLSKSYIRLIHNLGMKAFVNCLWTGDRKRRMQRAIAWGADFVQADKLDILVDVHAKEGRPSTVLDIQGHRGCRGHYPENSVEGFLRALDMGATTLELDVVVTKDDRVVVSHEPWISPKICLDSTSLPFAQDIQPEDYNIYAMTYGEMVQFDCGSKPVEGFPNQQKKYTTKPDLETVFRAVWKYCQATGKPFPAFNIETKTTPETDGVFHPEPERFVQLLLAVCSGWDAHFDITIQSFDPRTLEYLHRQPSGYKSALLIGEGQAYAHWLDRLSFTPDIISPKYTLLHADAVRYFQLRGILVIPWTVNDPRDIQQVLRMGVDGIISDYPDRVYAEAMR